jgi:hypothetical protein
MASGHVNRADRPNTWLHRPSLRREVFPCQLGAVHTWHIAAFGCRRLSVSCGHSLPIWHTNACSSSLTGQGAGKRRVIGGRRGPAQGIGYIRDAAGRPIATQYGSAGPAAEAAEPEGLLPAGGSQIQALAGMRSSTSSISGTSSASWSCARRTCTLRSTASRVWLRIV